VLILCQTNTFLLQRRRYNSLLNKIFYFFAKTLKLNKNRGTIYLIDYDFIVLKEDLLCQDPEEEHAVAVAPEVDSAVAAASAEVVEAAVLVAVQEGLTIITEDFTEDIGDLAVTDTVAVALEVCSRCLCSHSSL